jgi:DNA-binding HxlR family transcriptional regulator
MREHAQYCPVSLGSEVLADRWTMLILREMYLGSTRFNEIERGLPGISRSLLSQRLRRLERAGILVRLPSGSGRVSEYRLTAAGADLEPILTSIGEWAVRWMFTEPTAADVDPRALTWWMHRRVARENAPDRRVVIEFRYHGDKPLNIWLILDRGDSSVCIKHPGFDSDIVVQTDAVAMTRVFAGIDTLPEAIRKDDVRLLGPPSLTRRFGDWFEWSPFLPAIRAHLGKSATVS